MSKSKIIKDIVNEEVPLSQSLTRLQVIAYDLKNKSLEKWAEDELTGYTDEENVPEYRLKHSINFNYSGINNMVHLVKNVNLNPSLLGTDVLDKLSIYLLSKVSLRLKASSKNELPPISYVQEMGGSSIASGFVFHPLPALNRLKL